MNLRRVAVACVPVLVLAACAKKEEAAAPAEPAAPLRSSLDFDCSYAPSQSKVVSTLAGVGGGSAAVTAALGQALGLTVVLHSSGAFILTGGSGYIGGTLGAAAAGPIVVGVGVLVAGSAVTVELYCAPRNHPEMVSKVHEAAAEFAARSRLLAVSATGSVGAIVAQQRVTLIRSGADALAYANRASVEIAKRLSK